MESGFDFLEDAYVFENFGGDDTGPQLHAGLMVRMFGADAVCQVGVEPCELTPVAEGWMDGVNMTLDEGRSEGFAVSSLLFHAGHLDPKDFGAETVGGLSLFGNMKLQEELAYWAATQSVPSAVEEDVRLDAKEAMPFLAEVLSPDSEKHYRLAIARKTERGFAGGHALTPIGFYKGKDNLFWLRVYDNNFPERERALAIDPLANTWRYEFPSIDGEPIVYEGTPENGNKLYFSAVEDRLGVLKAPFAGDSGVRTITYAGIQLVAKRGARESGVRGGEILEAEGDRVQPAFSKCARCGEDIPIINQTLLNMGVMKDDVIEIDLGESVSSMQADKVGTYAGSGNIGKLSASGPDHNTHVTMDGDISKDTVSIDDKGSTTYTSNSGNGVEIKTNRKEKVGDAWVSTKISHSGSGSSDKPVRVDVTQNEDGETVVTVENLPVGKEVSLEVEKITYDQASGRYKTETEKVTFTSTGATSKARLDPGTSKVAVTGAANVTGGACDNGVKDEFETDVDCGGECPGCFQGKACTVDSDCYRDGTCTTGTCSLPYCAQDGANAYLPELQDYATSSDYCGGAVCEPCQASSSRKDAPHCFKDSDCAGGKCLETGCHTLEPVTLRANQLLSIGTTVRYRIWTDTFEDEYEEKTVVFRPNGNGPPYEMTLPEPAYKYQIVEAATCDYNPGILSTGSGPRNDETIANVMELDCDNSGALLKVVPNYVDLPQGVREVPRSNPAKLWVRMGSTVKEIDFWGRHPIHLGYYGVHDTYEVRVKKNPVRPIRYLVGTEFVTGHFVCTETPGASTGDGLSYRPPPAVTCTMKREVSCSDGLRSQDEVDVDCGGVCSTRCANNKWCWEYSDCQVSGCVNNRCVDDGNCSDNTHNQDELDVDCGGRCGDATCGDGQRCSTNAHCVSGNCSASGTCLAAACQDMIRNGEETDIDCGGSVCPQCAVSQACTVNSDCATFSCDGATQRCLGATCNDGIKNPGELHADCGGVCPRGCGEGLSCSKNTDCDSNLCTPNNTCGRATCSDGLPNQDESDIDCGGSICQPCGITGQCGRDSDCANNSCVSGSCTDPTCSDGVQNGDETDVDCGGSCAADCGANQGCAVAADCASNHCTGTQCAAATCADNIQNQGEAGVDCGGPCMSSCTTATCSDNVQNQGETGIDCGGPCPACTTSSACTTDANCSVGGDCECGASSGNCANNTGKCGAGKAVIDQPTVDGLATSGSFTVPAGCTQVYVEAWGAAGGNTEDFFQGFTNHGGPGGYVSGTLAVQANDVVDVWVGQGGVSPTGSSYGGTSGIGSYTGTLAKGGLGHNDGASGGGLTSVRVTGSTNVSFVIPAGAGAAAMSPGQGTEKGFGGGAMSSSGDDATCCDYGGGGAGEKGGALDFNNIMQAGSYGMYPAGFATADSPFQDHQPANTSAPDYALCKGSSNGQVKAGAGDDLLGSEPGGDGCVVLRCVAP